MGGEGGREGGRRRKRRRRGEEERRGVRGEEVKGKGNERRKER